MIVVWARYGIIMWAWLGVMWVWFERGFYFAGGMEWH